MVEQYFPVYEKKTDCITGISGFYVIGKVNTSDLIPVDMGQQILRTKNGSIIQCQNARSWLGRMFLPSKMRYVKISIAELECKVTPLVLAKCIDKVL